MQRRRFIIATSAGAAALAFPSAARPANQTAGWRARPLSLAAARRGLAASIAAASSKLAADEVAVAQWHLWTGLLEALAGARPDVLEPLYAAGQAAAQRAQASDVRCAGAYFFEAVHRAKRAEIRGVVASAFELPALSRLMARTDELAPGYGYYGTARFWGAVAAKTPTFLLRMKGSSLEEGDAYFRRAIRGRPDFAGNHVLRAPLLARLASDEAARKSLVVAERMPRAQSPGVEAWNRYYRQRATRLLSAMK